MPNIKLLLYIIKLLNNKIFKLLNTMFYSTDSTMFYSTDSIKRTLVVSFQGAFGPPTLGHYVAMKLFALWALTHYFDHKIVMMFMPTAKSSSKPHLALTQTSRLLTLGYFCELLKKECVFMSEDVTFEASDIEYGIYEQCNSSSTIHTIRELHARYSGATILLAMGFDNKLQQIYWESVAEYASMVTGILVVNRILDDTDKAKVRLFRREDGTVGVFQCLLPWTMPRENLMPVFGPSVEHEQQYDEKGRVVKDARIFTETIACPLPNERIIDEPVPNTSSSMLRHFIARYLAGRSDDYRKIASIMFGLTPPDDADAVIQLTLEDYSKNSPVRCLEDDAKYEQQFTDLKSELLVAGCVNYATV